MQLKNKQTAQSKNEQTTSVEISKEGHTSGQEEHSNMLNIAN